MKKSFFILFSLAALTAPAVAETEDPRICSQIEGKPGVYLVRSISDVDRLTASGRQKFQRDIRVYVIPPATQAREEVAMHLRVTSKAVRGEDNNAETTRLQRNKVATVCKPLFSLRKKPDWDNEDENSEHDIATFNDFADNKQRANKALNDWHFDWDAGRDKKRCRSTADYVTRIEGTKRRKPARLLVGAASTDEAVAETVNSEAASVTSVLVHQSAKGAACFAFRLFRNRDGGWMPLSTKIEAWEFGEVRNDAAKRTFNLQWTP